MTFADDITEQFEEDFFSEEVKVDESDAVVDKVSEEAVVDESDAVAVEDSEKKESYFSKFNLTGYFKNETAYRYDEPRSITKIRNIFYLSGQYPVNQRMKITAAGWAYHDLAYDLFDYETISARFVRDEPQPLVFIENLLQEKDSNVVDIRELYLDMFLDNMDIRVGKQFVVWGVLEGMRITDEINPQDFRELIAPDLLDYRIPLWTLKLDYYAEEATYQFLWIPDIKFHKPAPPGSEWELLQEVPNTSYPGSNKFHNSEFGIKMTREMFDAEISLSYFYTWDDFPVVFRKVFIDQQIDPVFYPTYTRINMYGATFVKQIGPRVVKGEIVYVPDKFFGLRGDTDTDHDGVLDNNGVLKKKHIRWGLGVDFTLWGMDVSPGVSQWIILDYEEGLFQDRVDQALTLFVRKPLPQKSAVFQMLVISLVNLNEMYIKPKITFDVTDHLQIAMGMDLFFGENSRLGVAFGGGSVLNLVQIEQSAQFFGNFHDNDRMFMEFKYTF